MMCPVNDAKCKMWPGLDLRGNAVRKLSGVDHFVYDSPYFESIYKAPTFKAQTYKPQSGSEEPRALS